MPAKIQRQPNQIADLYAQWHAEHQRTADAHEDQADRPAALGRGGQLGGEQAGEDDQQPATGRHSQASQEQAEIARSEGGERVAEGEQQQGRQQQAAAFDAPGQPAEQRCGEGEAEGEQGGELAGQADGDPQVFGQGRQDADQDAFRQAGGEGGQG